MVDERAEVLPGVRVRVDAVQDTGDMASVRARPWRVFEVPPPRDPVATGTSDEDGRCVITGLVAGRRVRVVTDTQAGYLSAARVLTTQPDGRHEITLVAAVARSVQGVVVQATGQPFPGHVRVHGSLGDARETTSTPHWQGTWVTLDHEGRFHTHIAGTQPPRFDVLLPGSRILRNLDGKLSADGGYHVTVPAFGTSKIHGLVRDVEGAPVVGARVGTRVSPPSGSTVEVLATTDERGAYALAQLPEGNVSALFVDAEGYAPLSLHLKGLRLDGEAALERNFKLVLGAVIWGRVTDTEGVALVGASVRAKPTRSARGLSSSLQAGTVKTDASGNYRFEGLLPLGDYPIGCGQAGLALAAQRQGQGRGDGRPHRRAGRERRTES